MELLRAGLASNRRSPVRPGLASGRKGHSTSRSGRDSGSSVDWYAARGRWLSSQQYEERSSRLRACPGWVNSGTVDGVGHRREGDPFREEGCAEVLEEGWIRRRRPRTSTARTRCSTRIASTSAKASVSSLCSVLMHMCGRGAHRITSYLRSRIHFGMSVLKQHLQDQLRACEHPSAPSILRPILSQIVSGHCAGFCA